MSMRLASQLPAYESAGSKPEPLTLKATQSPRRALFLAEAVLEAIGVFEYVIPFGLCSAGLISIRFYFLGCAIGGTPAGI